MTIARLLDVPCLLGLEAGLVLEQHVPPVHAVVGEGGGDGWQQPRQVPPHSQHHLVVVVVKYLKNVKIFPGVGGNIIIFFLIKKNLIKKNNFIKKKLI